MPTMREIHELFRTGQASAEEITTDALRRAHERNDELHAFISLNDEDALAAARRADADRAADNDWGGIAGIPLGIKDNLDVAGQVTTIGSGIHADRRPDATAPAVQHVLDAGGVMLGKNNLHEFALGVTSENPHFGDVHNPHDLAYIAGGSSGGGAAAVAAGIVFGAVGTDTSGSIRIPASCCGIAGLKPTYGLVDTAGCFPEAWSLDHIGPMAACVDDVRALLRALVGGPVVECAPLGKVRVGIEQSFFFHGIDPAVQRITDQALAAMAGTWQQVDVEIPHIANAEYALTIIDTSETTTVHRRDVVERPEIYGDDVRFLIECGFLPTAVDYLEAQQMRTLLKASFASVFEQVDVLVSPTLPIPVPKLGQADAVVEGEPVDVIETMMRLVGPANLLGLPSLSVPIGQLDGLPVGLQILGPAGADERVLAVGEQLEQALSRR